MRIDRSAHLLRHLLTGIVCLALLAGGLAVGARDASAASKQRYLVQTTSSSAAARPFAHARRAGGVVLGRFEHVLHGFTAELTPAQAARLAADPAVVAVVPDVAYQVSDEVAATASQAGPPWGLDRIDQRTAALDGRYDYLTTGAGGTVFVLDTGVRLTHREFAGRATSGWDFVGNDGNASDCVSGVGHGTHVAGTVAGSTYGVAKGTRIVALRVLDCDGGGYVSHMIEALDWVLKHRPAGPAVVNMSLGFKINSSNAAVAGLVDQAVGKVDAARIPVVVSAGNDAADSCGYSPARTPKAITVAASDDTDTRADFSNRGGCVDLFAPGVDVLSAFVTSDTAAAYYNGTSMAAPHVAGAIARMQQDNPLAASTTIVNDLLGRATPGVVTDPAGAPNRLLYLTPPGLLAGKPAGATITKSDSAKTVTVRWSPPTSTGGLPITGYRLIRTGSADAKSQRIAVANLAATARSYTFGSLVAGGTYTVRIVPVTANGPGWSAGFTTKLLAVPGKPGIRKASSGTKKSKGISVTARWSKPSSGGAVASYRVKADRVGSKKDKTVTVSAAKREVKITGLAKNKKYKITVRGLNAGGGGAWSNKSNKVTAR